MVNDLKSIFSRVLKIDEESITDDVSRGSFDSWDSFNHLLLVSEIEKKMGTKFTMQEIEELKTFQEIKEKILKKLEI